MLCMVNITDAFAGKRSFLKELVLDIEFKTLYDFHETPYNQHCLALIYVISAIYIELSFLKEYTWVRNRSVVLKRATLMPHGL